MQEELLGAFDAAFGEIGSGMSIEIKRAAESAAGDTFQLTGHAIAMEIADDSLTGDNRIYCSIKHDSSTYYCMVSMHYA